MIKLICLYLCLSVAVLHAQRQYDVDHYLLEVQFSEDFQMLKVNEQIQLSFTDTCSVLALDLVAPKNGKGMVVKYADLFRDFFEPPYLLEWEQQNEVLMLSLRRVFQKGEIFTIHITLEGSPQDGLIIGQNKYNEPTIFADNWPNRAHHWYACNDHPSDKATYAFFVEAPIDYKVVANGSLISKSSKAERNSNVWHYVISEPIPTKVAVIGIADLLTKDVGQVGQIPILGTVYPKDSLLGLSSFAVAPHILQFYQDLVGPYPFKELNNVQSTTRYGGMENAGCIFYDENSLNADLRSTHLIAHEIAHQWFGNGVTEADWQHLWLSEGFATYLTNMYIETYEGQKAFNKQLQSDRIRVINLYNNGFHQALVDSLTPSLLDRLNANAYQKGAWVLHMLRHEMGDSLFKLGLQQFYTNYQYQNATSQDFAHLMDSLSPKDLAPFFNQWLYQSGHPQLKTRIFSQKGRQYLEVTQIQDELFTFPLQISIVEKGTTIQTLELLITKRTQEFRMPNGVHAKDMTIDADPHLRLLFELVK